MEKNYRQLELFSQGQKGQLESKPQREKKFSFNYIANYEKIILVIISLVITGVVSFSLGIEKGKTLARRNNWQTIATGKTPARSEIEKPEVKTEGQDISKPPAAKETFQYYYTIQLASYQNKTSAEKEARELKKKGLLPLVQPKGRYTVLCVGNFSDKELAKTLHSQLKKRYQDCFIRRL